MRNPEHLQYITILSDDLVDLAWVAILSRNLSEVQVAVLTYFQLLGTSCEDESEEN